MTVEEAKQTAQYYIEYAAYLDACINLEELLSIPYVWNSVNDIEYMSEYPTIDCIKSEMFVDYFTGWRIDKPIKASIKDMLKHFIEMFEYSHPHKNAILKNARTRDNFLAKEYNTGALDHASNHLKYNIKQQ